MARKVQTVVIMTDDLDGTRADMTVRFAVEGTQYEIDLSAKNAKKFSDLIGPYVGAARKARRTPPNRRPSGPAVRGPNASRTRAIREWARSNGWPDIGDRGRIPIEVQDAYDTSR